MITFVPTRWSLLLATCITGLNAISLSVPLIVVINHCNSG